MTKQNKILKLKKLENELISAREVQPILNQELVKVDKKELINILDNIIDSIEVNENCVLINLNKTLIIKSENFVHIAEKYGICLTGNKLHLNPVLDVNPKKHLEEIKKIKKELE